MATQASKSANEVPMVSSTCFSTPAAKTSVGLKMVKKKKVNLNSTKKSLKSVPVTPMNFSFHNMSVQKQTLRANNKALAQNLAKVKLDVRRLQKENMELESQNQGMQQELRRLKLVVGLKDTEIDDEVQRRIEVHMLEIKKSLESAAEFMAKSSDGITNSYQKCLAFCGSSASSRQSSLSNRSSLTLLDYSSNSQRRSAVSRRSSFSPSQTEFLSKADELGFRHVGDVVHPAPEPSADMSVIMEQSILSEDVEKLPMTASLPTVSEKGDLQGANSSAANGKNTKLPQRIPRQTSRENLKALNTVNQISQNANTVEQQNITSKSKSKSKKRVNSESGDQNELEKKKSCLLEDENKTSELVETGKPQARNNFDEKLISDDFDQELCNLSGINFDDLVSGSPITPASEKVARRETFSLSKAPAMGQLTEAQPSKKAELSERSKSVSNSHKAKTKELNGKLRKGSATEKVSLQKEESKQKKSTAQSRRDTYVSANPFKPNTTLKRTPIATESANETKLLDQNEAKGEIENPFKPKATLKRTPEASEVAVEKEKEKEKHKNQLKTKTKSKTNTTSKSIAVTSSQKPKDKIAVAYPEHVENPFKPTRNLLRSPPPASKLDSKQFLAKLCNKVDTIEVDSEPFLGSSFDDEPTTYISVDMELTVPLSVSGKRSPFENSMEQISEYSKQTEFQDKDTRRNKTDRASAKNNTNAKEQEVEAIRDENTTYKTISQNSNTIENKDFENENADQRESISIEKEKQKALVEMRIDKPGKFTFAASRKEADGSRKPVPEKVTSHARSKKKQLTPDKDPEPNLGPDRDLFNFGDRTPTVPLNKIIQEKASSVYDLSINESVIGPPITLNNFKEKSKVQNDLQETVEAGKEILSGTSAEGQSDGIIYHLPLKGSPEEKPKQRRGRSKSGTRSKSKSRKSNDEDYEPYKSRSKSRSRKTTRTVDDGVDSCASRSKSRTRGRSRTRKCMEATNSKTTVESRSESPEMVHMSSEVNSGNHSSDQELAESPLVRKSARCRSRVRPVITSEDLDNAEITVESGVPEAKGVDVTAKKHETVTNTKRSVAVLSSEPDKFTQNETELNSKNGEKIEAETVNKSSKTKSHPDEKDVSSPHMKEKESSNIYYLPLKGSPVESKRNGRTRSKSRSRHASESENEEPVSRRRTSSSRARSSTRQTSESECEQYSSDKPRSRSTRSKSQTRQPSESENEHSVAKRQSRTRSRSRLRSSTGSASENVDQCNSENEASENRSKEHPNNKINIAVLSVGDSDSDFQNEAKHRRKSRRQTKVNKDTDGGISSDTVDNDEIKSKTTAAVSNNVKEISNKNDHMDRLSDDSSFSSLSNDISSKFVNKCRGRSIRSGLKENKTNDRDTLGEVTGTYIETEVEHVSLENNKKTGNRETLDSNSQPAKHTKRQSDEDVAVSIRTKNSEKEHSTITTEEQLNLKTPAITNAKTVKSSKSVKKKSKETEVKKSSKSAKKQSMKEVEAALETPVLRRDEKNDFEDEMTHDDLDDDKNESSGRKKKLPFKTPSVMTGSKSAASSKSAKTKTAKSSRKKREVVCDDQTPKGKATVKTEKSSHKKSEKENEESDSKLASLKRRLTALSSSNMLLTKSSLPPADDDIENDGKDSCLADSGELGSANKRARRTKATVSYVSIPLNKKLRQGDDLFQNKAESKSPISKEKAEKMRVILGQRKTILSERMVQDDLTVE